MSVLNAFARFHNVVVSYVMLGSTVFEIWKTTLQNRISFHATDIERWDDKTPPSLFLLQCVFCGAPIHGRLEASQREAMLRFFVHQINEAMLYYTKSINSH